MSSNLEKYRERTKFMEDSLPSGGCFCTSDSLKNKADDNGRFQSFYGDTIIFSLDDDTVGWLGQLQDEIYKLCGNMLSERLDPSTFHITLHDLKNSPYSMPDDVNENKHHAVEVIKYARKKYPNGIYINSRCVFSMVNTSIVMGFEPETNEDCDILMQLYEDFQSIVPLSYPLTLHTTLAYYKPGIYNEDMLGILRDVFHTVGKERRRVRLDLDKLSYTTFSNMNYYETMKKICK